uniref:Transmembrane protein n=1 Tax=Opuntia streptacantha TaxID=393608 RepID=A0A7C9ASA5_OPUST
MASTLLDYVQNVWPFSILRADDVKLSDQLVRKLSIPKHTKQFVFAISEPESKGTVYILCAQNLSERSAKDAEYLIREVRPDAVVAIMGDCALSEIHEYELVERMNDLVPTSAFEVLLRSFMDKTNKDNYENLAGNLVLREIFGVGFYGHFFVSRRMAEEIGSYFLALESRSVKTDGAGTLETSNVLNKVQSLAMQPASLVPQNLGSVVRKSRRFFIANDLQFQMVKLVSPSVASSLGTKGSSVDTASGKVEPSPDYRPPSFAEMIYPLLMDLHDIFSDIPSMGRALTYAQKVFDNVHRGEVVDAETLSEVYSFQIAVEGLRVALTNAGKLPIHKLRNPASCKIDFHNLSDEEKSQCLLAQALRSQMKKFKTVVAVVDAAGLAGLRKFWNTPVPKEIGAMFEEIVVCQDFGVEGTKDGKDEKKGLLSAKPVVAVGAGATAVLGASSLSKVLPVSTVVKVVTLNVPTSLKIFLTQTYKATSFALSKILGPSKVVAPGFASSGAKMSTAFKAAASAEKIRAVTHSVIASAEKTSFSAMRTAFYEIMRKRRIKPIGVMPWATFGFSMATCGGLLAFGDGIECAAESLPAAPSIASLGRGIQNLQQASDKVRQTSRHKIQNAIESLMYRFRNLKIQ